MPLYTPSKDQAPPPTSVIEPEVEVSQVYESHEYKTPTITDIEGEPWVCDFYHQLIRNGESPQPFDPNLEPTLQQYLKVSEFRLSVTGDLQYTQDATTQLSTLSGEGLIYPSTVAPHIGDMFIAYLEAGRKGLFTLTSVQALGYYKKTVYQVEYRLFSDQVEVYAAPMDARVVQYRYFDVRRLTAGYSPLIEYKTANSERHYYKELRRLMDALYTRHYNNHYKTFIVGNMQESFYDPWAVDFFLATIPSKIRGTYPSPIQYSLGNDLDLLDRPTLWACLINQTLEALPDIPRHYKAKGTTSLTAYSLHTSIANSGIDWVYLPEVWHGEAVDVTELPYLFTHAFYEGSETLTLVEAGIRDAIGGHAISNTALSLAVEEALASTGIEGLRKLILVIGILKFKLIGV